MTPGLRTILFSGWTPARLGPSLLGMWDADRTDLITQSGGLVSSWTDVVAGFALAQAVSGSKPAYSATGFNGRAAVIGDGSDDELTITPAPASFPLLDGPGEMWALVDQTAAPIGTTTSGIAGYGASAGNSRRLNRTSNGSVNRGVVTTGTGSTLTAGIPAVEFIGRHIIRGIFGATEVTDVVDGIAGTPTAAVAITVNSRLRAFALNNSAASGFLQGGINLLAFTAPLTVAQAAAFTNYLKTRGGIA